MTEARATAAPVLKWAGGKRQIVKQILELLPTKISTYYEPFVGGGAVFFALYNERRFERAVIGDKNPELVNVYQALKHDVSGVIRALKKLKERHSEEHYYAVRGKIPSSDTARAARVLYLNKTGFNGLYRVNRSGHFNVPFGRYDQPKIVNEPRLRAAADALANVEIVNEDFEVIAKDARAGDAVYFDPPYLPISATSAFTEYFADPFGIDAHKRLAKAFDALSRKGVAAVLSNSDTPVTRGLFEKHQLQIVSVRRAINSVATRRGGVGEILVTAQSMPPKRRTAAARRPLG
ncbi:MAG: DNA adenine methylase [Myxococcota bacterium]|nr:DNA adenine methylase [Myxococcota bacterium]